MTARVVDVEVALAPGGISWSGVRLEAGRQGTFVHGVNVIDPQHDSTPDGFFESASRVELKVQIAASDPEAGKGRILSSVE